MFYPADLSHSMCRKFIPDGLFSKLSEVESFAGSSDSPSKTMSLYMNKDPFTAEITITVTHTVTADHLFQWPQ